MNTRSDPAAADRQEPAIAATQAWSFRQRAREFPATFSFWKDEGRPLLWIVAIFLAIWFLPLESPRLQHGISESLQLAQWYAHEHVLLCLIPAFFIAGAIGVFISSQAVMKYLGPDAPKPLAYGVGSVSGTLLAVCSCTILPLFAGIYRMGAGLGPAVAFLYSGPAINALAIILTARVLGFELGVARAVGAILFGVVIGLLMHLIFRRELRPVIPTVRIDAAESRPLFQTGLFLAALVSILIFATWAEPVEPGLWATVHAVKWPLVALAAAGMAVMAVLWLGMGARAVTLAAAPVAGVVLLFPEHPTWAFVTGVLTFSLAASLDAGAGGEWFRQTWGFARQILPLLFLGVLIAGALLGRPGHEALIPSHWIAAAVGGNSLGANFMASFAGAFMYFATLTEIPILQGLIGSGMGQGPALALLLAGPALSLPNMLVIRGVMGTRKTLVYVALVVVMATASGSVWGWLIA